MWATIGGNTFACRSGWEIVPPALTDAITDSIEFSITVLPAVLPVISIACMIGTPADTRDENVRAQRAIATFCTTSPICSGIRSLNASQCGRPHFDLLNHRN